jgi:phosphoglycerate dehydrogenase-like enzyme
MACMRFTPLLIGLLIFQIAAAASPRRIVVATGDPQRLDWLREAVTGSKVTLESAGSLVELRNAVVDADGLIGPCDATAIMAGKNLHWVQTSGVGVEECLAIPAIHEGHIILTNVPRVNAATVAEHTMALMLAVARQIPAFVRKQRDATWSETPPAHMVCLEGKTLLIVGLGSNGTEIAARAQAFHMRIIGIRKEQGEKPAFVDYVGKPDELPALVERADFIVNSTPLTRETTGLFNAALLAHMRRGAFFFNVGRGKSVVTEDLIAALRIGRIAGAGLDVVDPEPLPKDSPLWKMPNVVITAHVGDESEQKEERSWQVMRENLRRYAKGEELLTVVDVRRGY